MKHNQGRLVFDTTLQEIGDRFFDDQNKVLDQSRDFYLEAVDQFPHDMPEALDIFPVPSKHGNFYGFITCLGFWCYVIYPIGGVW